MAGFSRIIGRITHMGGSSTLPDDQGEFIVQYRCTGPVTGLITGETVLLADVTVSEAQINNQLRAALAAHVDPLVKPPQAYVAGDVRGLNL